MSVEERKNAIDNIARTLAISKYDIELHQSISDYSLNIFGENFYRDVLNKIYGLNLDNANFFLLNAPCIDLVDDAKKVAIQVTTTTSKEKIEKTLAVLTIGKYANYQVKLFYLLNKPVNMRKATIVDIERKYGIVFKETILDMNDVVKEIHNMQTDKLLELNNLYFRKANEIFTDKRVLDLTIRHILMNKKKCIRQYDDSFGSVETEEKIKINNLNARVTLNINKGLDYRSILQKTDEELVEQLREFVVFELYKNLLVESVANKVKIDGKESIDELHLIAQSNSINFNKLMYALSAKLDSYVENPDFNSIDISWIIISFFFEICDIGTH